MLETYADMAKTLAALPRLQQTLLVGVDGPGGAGKSTFAQGLAAALAASALPATVIHLDDFYRPSKERLQGFADGLPSASDFDWERLRDEVLHPLAHDQPAHHQRYDWPSDTLAEWHSLAPGGAVIVEGISALRNELTAYYDYKIWVESPRTLRLQRGLERDGEAARGLWEDEWMPAEEHYFHLHRPREQADLWVEGSSRPGIDPSVAFFALRQRQR